MPLLKIKEIKIKPNRQRQYFDQKALEQLADSIRTTGLIEPVIIDTDNYLIAGERRVRACELLGWDEVRVDYFNSLDPWKQEVAQLDENLHRESLSYPEELMAKKKLHLMYIEKYGSPKIGRAGDGTGWKIKDTAERLGISVGKASEDLQLADALEKNPSLGKLKSKIAAKNQFKRDLEIKSRTLIAALTQDKKTKSNKSQEEKKSNLLPPNNIQLIHGDCLKIIPTLEDNSISSLITDPPWDVGYDFEFNNEEENALILTSEMLKHTYPKLQEGALCLLFCATRHLITGNIYNLINRCGYRIFDTIFIWTRPGVAHTSHPYQKPSNDYEPILFFSKGQARDMTRPSYSLLEHLNKGTKLHPAQKPISLYKDLIEKITAPGETILDPFTGSANCLMAADELGRKSIGIEMNETSYTVADSSITIYLENKKDKNV